MPPLPAVAIGIDLGYSGTGDTSAISFFSVVSKAGVSVVDVIAETEVMGTAALRLRVASERRFDDAALVAVDAPLTPTHVANRPERGRLVDARFSRGAFSNGKRGLQPGSISTPVPGWKLYEAGMALLPHLARRGFNYFSFPSTASGEALLPKKAVVEVIPKLTQGLLAPRELVVSRPKQGGFQQLDDWLFPHLFVTAPIPAARGPDLAYPRHGAHGPAAIGLIGSDVQLGARALKEANRIQGMGHSARHEALGAFVAGFQAAVAVVGQGSLVGAPGANEGYFLLPAGWHSDWENAWAATERTGSTVRRVAVGLR